MNDTINFRCTQCGVAGLVELYDPRIEQIRRFEGGATIQAEAIERNLEPCSCGGRFTLDAPLRCPTCSTILSEDEVRRLANYPMSKKYHPFFILAEPVTPAWVKDYAM